MRAGRNTRGSVALCLSREVIHHSLPAIRKLIVLKTVVFIPIMLKVLRLLVSVGLFLSVILQLKVLVMKLRGSHLIVKRFELDGLLVSLCRLFCASTFTQTSEHRRTAFVGDTGHCRTPHGSDSGENGLEARSASTTLRT